MTLNLPLPMENDALRLEVWPQIGGKISSIIDKSDRFDLLFSYPAELPVSSQYDLAYANSWYAGWDECFPAGAASVYPVHPYSGVPVPDHGELWGLPAQATPARDGLSLVWHGLRFGYRLTRTLRLEGPTLVAEYELKNLAPFQFRFVWSPHALLSMSEPVVLDLPGGMAMDLTWASDAGSVEPRRFDWPLVPGEADFSRLNDLPEHKAWKAISVKPSEAAAVVRYPSRGRRLRIVYQSDQVRAYWSVWLNAGGWAGQRHFAVAPVTGRADGIGRAISDGSAGRVGPLTTARWAVRWTVESDSP